MARPVKPDLAETASTTTKEKTTVLRATVHSRNALKSIAALLGKPLYDVTELAIEEFVRRRSSSGLGESIRAAQRAGSRSARLSRS